LVLIFGYITWGQFGWRTYSKLAADMRIKNADEQRTSFVLVNCFTTLLKLDMQVELYVWGLGFVEHKQHQLHGIMRSSCCCSSEPTGSTKHAQHGSAHCCGQSM